MEWIWVVLVAAILLGPVLLALLRGRRSETPSEDARGMSAYGAAIKDRAEIDTLGGPPPPSP